MGLCGENGLPRRFVIVVGFHLEGKLGLYEVLCAECIGQSRGLLGL